MFKNREIRVRVAKTNEAPHEVVDTTPRFNIKKEDVVYVTNSIVKTVAGATIAVIAAKAAANTAQEIAIHHGTKH